MRIAVCASEGAPYAKSGGLGDVMEALPAALARIEGNEVALFLPYYNKIKQSEKYPVELVAQFRVGLGWRQQYAGLMKLTNRNDGVQVYFIDNEYYFGGRTGAIYGDLDDGERYAFFSRACLDAMAIIGEGAKLKYVILDKNVTVRPGAKLYGTAKNPIIVKRGEVV